MKTLIIVEHIGKIELRKVIEVKPEDLQIICTQGNIYINYWDDEIHNFIRHNLILSLGDSFSLQ